MSILLGCYTFGRVDGNYFGVSCWKENETDECLGSIKMNSLTYGLRRADEWTECMILVVCPMDWLLPFSQGLSSCLSDAPLLFFFIPFCLRFWPFGLADVTV